MLRADLLDAIDTILKSVRRRNQLAFGGVQILFIGDLFQIPPVMNTSIRLVSLFISQKYHNQFGRIHKLKANQNRSLKVSFFIANHLRYFDKKNE